MFQLDLAPQAVAPNSVDMPHDTPHLSHTRPQPGFGEGRLTIRGIYP